MTGPRWHGDTVDGPDEEASSPLFPLGQKDSGERRTCRWPSCHGRDSVELIQAEPGTQPVAVCGLHRKNVLGVSS